MSDELLRPFELCPECGKSNPYIHQPGYVGCLKAQLTAATARIAELEKQLQTWKELYEAAAMRNALLGVGVKAQAKTLMNLYAVACDDDGPYGGWVVADAVSEVAAELTALLGQEKKDE